MFSSICWVLVAFTQLLGALLPTVPISLPDAGTSLFAPEETKMKKWELKSLCTGDLAQTRLFWRRFDTRDTGLERYEQADIPAVASRRSASCLLSFSMHTKPNLSQIFVSLLKYKNNKMSH